MRNVQVSGRVCNFGKVYRAAEGDKGAFCVVFINMPLDRKDEETGYTATTPVKLMAGNYWADRLNDFQPGETVYVTGKLDKENDWTNNDGELIKGGLYVRIEMIDNWAAESSNSKSAAKPAAASKPSKPAAAKPGKPAPKRPAVNK